MDEFTGGAQNELTLVSMTFFSNLCLTCVYFEHPERVWQQIT